MKPNFVIGIDEVGRGALAGPVVVAALACKSANQCKECRKGTLKDSKKLSAKQRETWYAHFADHPGITFAVARVYPRGIEKLNISQAANLAAYRALKRLKERGARKKDEGRAIFRKQSMFGSQAIFLDGGLFLGNKKWQGVNHSSAKTMVKADETIPAVAMASIIAKVHRDGYMRRLAKKYSVYGFDIHKGYGTKAHYAAIKKHGFSKAHRLTFLKKHSIIT
jgi:ribonuclease HII